MKNNAGLPTLDDVAKLAGVSKAVASRALSGKNRPVSADKKYRVLKAAENLGYVANPFARSLINQSTGLIAIVVNHIADLSDLTLFDALLQAIQSVGKQCLFIRLRSEDDIADIKQNPFVHRGVDAALIFSDLIEPDEAPSLFYTHKVIMLNGKKSIDGFSVIINEALGIKDAVQYASKHGITQALLLCGRETSLAEQQRVYCYQQMMNENHIKVIQSFFCNYAYQEALLALQSMTLIRGTESLGIFCTSDSMAMAAIDFCRNKMFQLIEQKAIFGFDNTPFSQLGGYQFSSIGYCHNEFIQQILTLLTHDEVSDLEIRHLTVASRFYCR